jgi:hypothetical protein
VATSSATRTARARDDAGAVNSSTRAAVNATVARFAKALEARDMAALERVYPGLSAAERDTWAAFFDKASAVRARFTAENPRATSAGVDVTVLGDLRFTKPNTRRPVTQTVSFSALVQRTNGVWTIRSMQ